MIITITFPSASSIWNTYNAFRIKLEYELKDTYTRNEIEQMPAGDFIKFARKWLANNKY